MLRGCGGKIPPRGRGPNYPVVVSRRKKTLFHPAALRKTLRQLIDLIEHLRFELLGPVRLRNRDRGVRHRVPGRSAKPRSAVPACRPIGRRTAQCAAPRVRESEPDSFGSRASYSVRASRQRFGEEKGLRARDLRLHRGAGKFLAQRELQRRDSLPRRLRFIVQRKAIIEIEIIRGRGQGLFAFRLRHLFPRLRPQQQQSGL